MTYAKLKIVGSVLAVIIVAACLWAFSRWPTDDSPGSTDGDGDGPTRQPAPSSAPDKSKKVGANASIEDSQLTFEAPEQVPKAKPHQTEFKTSYRFTNTSKKAVTITKLKSTCACLPADMKKKIYKPGEKGEIQAVLKFAHNRGKFVKEIFVNTLDEDGKPTMYTLKIGAIIPEFAKFDRRFHNWDPSGKMEARRFRMTIIHKDPIHVLKVDSSNPKWTASFKEVKKGREYEVWLTPPAAKEASRTALSVEVDYPAKKHLVFRLIGRVMQPTPKTNDDGGWLDKMKDEDGN